MSTHLTVKPSQASEALASIIKARLVPMLSGSPGCGKSQIVHQLADAYQLKVIDLRLAQCDPTDLLGLPSIQGNRAGYAPMNTFPIEGDELPEGKNGWLLFLDEFSSASPAVQAAAYKVVLDRMVGIYKLHENLAIVCAGNLETDNAIVQPMSTALQSRLVHLELQVDAQEWTNWAEDHDVDFRITSYIKFKPANLYTFKPDHTDKTYASPRTWEFTNRLLKTVEIDSPMALPLLSGTISEGVAREFIGFCKIYKDLPTIESIMEAPNSLKVPDEPSVLFALTGAVAQNATNKTIPKLIDYIVRLPIEFQIVCLREAIRRNKEIVSSQAIRDWIKTNATELF